MKYLILFLFSYASGSAESIGFYTKGRLAQAKELPFEGEGFIRLYTDLNEGWGTQVLLDLITSTAADLSKRYPQKERLQVESLSNETGGKITSHGSHQNGLDVDLAYFRVDAIEHDPTPAQYYSPSMVVKGKISENFDTERNWELMKTLHRNGRVNRIFVDKIIKKTLCAHAKSIGEDKTQSQVLRSLRHVDNHQDHLHVRLQCPKDSKKCIDQALVSGGTGCP